MQKAVDEGNSRYKFSSTYSQNWGYMIDEIDGTRPQQDEKCYWAVYVRDRDGKEVFSNLGVSSLAIANGCTLLLKYQSY